MSIRSLAIEQAKSADSIVADIAKKTGIDGYEVRQALSAMTRFLADAMILDKRKLPKRIPGVSRKLERLLLEHIM